MSHASIEPQQIFDRVARHLRHQPIRSLRQGRVAVRGHRDTRDPLGCLLTDTEIILPDDIEVDPERVAQCGRTLDALRQFDLDDIVNLGLIPERFMPHMGLIANLCAVHDNPWNWRDDGSSNLHGLRRGLEQVAELHALDSTDVCQMFP